MQSNLSRRNFLKTAGIASTFLSFSKGFGAEELIDMPHFFNQISLGVASGDPTQSTVELWVGMPAALQSQSIELRWEISLFPHFSNVEQSGIVWTSLDSGGNAQVQVTDLRPGTIYFYRFFQSDLGFHSGFESLHPFQSRLGRTKTLPSNPKNLNFSFVSCFDFTNGHFTALHGLFKSNCDFVISLGDNIYETGSAPFQSKKIRTDSIGGGSAKTLLDYRNKYRLYLTDKHLLDARAHFPWFTLWDDHEFFNNFPGQFNAQNPDKSSSILSIGSRAFYEYNPVCKSRKSRTYFKRSVGDLVDFFFLDQRSYRSLTPCGDTFSWGCQDMASSERTMLGKDQLNWLLSELKQSRATHKIIANETMIMPMTLFRSPHSILKQEGPLKHFKPQMDGLYANLDSWDGFPHERALLLQSISENKVNGVVFCTGDIHTSIAGAVHRIPNQSKKSPIVAHELVTSSVTSSTFADFASASASPLVEALLKQANPEYTHIDTVNHGIVNVHLHQDNLVFKHISPYTTETQKSEHFISATGSIYDHQLISQKI